MISVVPPANRCAVCTSGLVKEGTDKACESGGWSIGSFNIALPLFLSLQSNWSYFADSLNNPEEDCEFVLGMDLKGLDLWSVSVPKVQDCCQKCKDQNSKCT